MAAYMDNQKMTAAIEDNTKLVLDSQVITTQNWMQLNPIYIKEMVPGEKVTLNIESLMRMNPLAVPTFGRANNHLRVFKVPFRTIYPGFNDFITDAPHTWSDLPHDSFSAATASAALLGSVPYVTNRALASAFVFDPGVGPNSMVETLSESATSGSYDFIYDTGQATQYRMFTNKGRHAYKVLTDLGYAPCFDNANDTARFSAMPLLAFAKVYCDYYFPSQYYDSLLHSYIEALCKNDSQKDGVLELNSYDVFRILSLIFVSWDSDYFVSAFDNPVGPSNDTFSTFSIKDPTFVNTAGTPYLTVEGGTNGTTYAKQNNNSSSVVLTQYVDSMLKATTSWMRRNQFAGSRAWDRYIARYGKALDSAKFDRCNYVGGDYIPIQIGDVMSTSDTNGAVLGAYAGKGLGYGQPNSVQVDTDEFCYIIVMASLVPAIGYYQGSRPIVERTSRFDFYTPEYDGIGCQPIPASQLFRPMNYSSTAMTSTGLDAQIFGYTPRYADYKVSFDTLSGNFRVPSLTADLMGSDAWHLMRKFDEDDFGSVTSGVTHSLNFVYAKRDGGQFNRIFNNIKEDAPDQFTAIYNITCHSQFPGKSLYDICEFEEKGKKMTMDVNGVKMN